LENGHRAHECCNLWRPLNSLACLAAPPVSCHVAGHHHASASCVGSMGSVPPSKEFRCGSRASVVSTPAGSVPLSDVVLQSTLVAQVEQLQGCLVQIASFLERAEATLSKISPLPAMLETTHTLCPPSEVGVDSTEDWGAELYGCFSPRFWDSPSSPSSALPSVLSATEGEAISAFVTVNQAYGGGFIADLVLTQRCDFRTPPTAAGS
jgi:hypothetical protein